MVKVKFCGLTRPEDIETTNRLQPDYAGFVFAPNSRRRVSADVAVRLIRALDSSILPVGVFMNQPLEDIEAAAASVPLYALQLHGDPGPEQIEALRQRTQLAVWGAFTVRDADSLTAAADSPADLVLLDSGAGTGERFNWDLITDFPRPYLLAGGLAPENVREAIARLSLFGLDVSSGIETGGRKDPSKMQAFMKALTDVPGQKARIESVLS